ncbi:unnamed protein product [Allacma fusca]|uniref:DH domain-containing protein n=1 Tax=Allacma fusca TaxID=39272 RepID=A0A8J2PVD5_9HEXA|nr:unnamed protein product [Allacma fusca]
MKTVGSFAEIMTESMIFPHHLKYCESTELRRMLGQRLESEEKAQTLPRLDGQDEGDGAESHHEFDILTIANSCPDLTILDPPEAFSQNGMSPESLPFDPNSDMVDGLFFKSSLPLKLPLSFRRSSSLTSLTNEEYNETSEVVRDGNPASVIQPGIVAKLIGACEGNSIKDKGDGPEGPELVLSSNVGTGSLHKSVSTPSVTQIFASNSSVSSDPRPNNKNVSQSSQRDPAEVQTSFSSQSQSYKRSFFRRKHKPSKSSHINSQPPVIVQHYRNLKMDGSVPSGLKFEEGGEESVSSIALSNPALGLQDPDVDCWAMFMGKDLVAQLDEKEVKRQEHMYELILTEKHHCLTLALMHHLFVGGMKKAGYSRTARLLFPGLAELLQVHFTFLQRMRERQLRFRDMGQPLDTLADLINEQFSGEQWQQMVRLYGLLCASHKHSLDLFKSMQKESKFAALVNCWSKEPLLARKNVPECLLLVAQRITKYPLLFEPLYKTSTDLHEREQITKVLKDSRELNEKVNERVAERERLIEFCQKLDHKSVLQMGQNKSVRKDYLTSLPSRRLLFNGLASAVKLGANGSGFGGSGGPGSARSTICNVLVLTDCLVFVQEFGGRYHFVSPPILPGIVTLNNLILRENAGQNTSLFLVWNSLGSKADKPEMIELQVINPPNRDKWVDTIRDASTKWQEDGDALSEGDEEFFSDAVDYSDTKTARALEELLEQDRQIMTLLRSRSKLVETLKTDKPHLWSSNQCDGKDNVLNAISNASEEIQRMIHNMDSSVVNGVNRSASCAADHVTSGMLTGLPRRADTFGGFDSQQRSGADSGSQVVNNKVLFQMVIQLAELCGEMFQQMIPQLTPQISQSQHQLQRRMEDLREAQQRLETEKAEWQREFTTQKEEIERQLTALNTKAGMLQNEERDISEQREKLYRKLEALQRQGIRPALEAVSPISVSASTDKPASVVPPPRRTVSQVQIPPATPQVPSTISKPAKQQIPHFLAHSSAVKSLLPPSPGMETPKPMPRAGITKPPPPLPPNQSNISDSNRSSQGNGPRHPRGASQPVQQILPYRLMEGLKTSSLPRGVGSRSVSSMGHSQSLDQQSVNLNSSNSKLRNSSSPNPNQVLHHSHSATSSFAGDPTVSSYGVRSSTNDRMSSYYRNPNLDKTGYMDNNYNNYGPNVIRSGVPIVHRRAGSSPVPMSSTPVNSNPVVSNRPRDDEFDMTNVLFL